MGKEAHFFWIPPRTPRTRFARAFFTTIHPCKGSPGCCETCREPPDTPPAFSPTCVRDKTIPHTGGGPPPPGDRATADPTTATRSGPEPHPRHPVGPKNRSVPRQPPLERRRHQ